MADAAAADGPAVTQIAAAAYLIPTDAPEADGTLTWDATTMVLATARAGGAEGIGWSYAAAAARNVITPAQTLLWSEFSTPSFFVAE